MKGNDNQPQWDAKRLIQEYVKKADLINHYRGKPFKNIVWSNQIRIKRIASALRAFLGMKGVDENPIDFITSVFDGWDIDNILENSALQEEDSILLHTLLKDAIADDERYASIMRMAESRRDMESSYKPAKRRKNKDRGQMLDVLLQYRMASEEIISHFDGVMEANVGGCLGIMAVKGLCILPLQHNNDKIDDIIVILLGDKFKQVFSEEMLQAEYGYPKETDSELFEWDCDNW